MTAQARSTNRRAAGAFSHLLDAGLRLRQVERFHAPGRLARDAQGLAAGRQDAQLGAGTQQAVRKLGAGRDQVLTVVQHQ
jgi:hypothetical protein